MFEKDGKELILYDLPDFINEKKEVGNCLDDFDILKVLDDDNDNNKNSKVFKVKSKKDFSIYAMKRISLKLIQENNLFSEIDFFKAANHPNIIKYINSFYDHDYIYLIMEYMNNCDLEKYNKLNDSFRIEILEEKIFKISYECLSALDYIHKANRKRQIQLKHIFIDDDFNIKIGILSISSLINYNKELEDIHVLGNSLNRLYKNENYFNDNIKMSLYSFLEFIEGDKNVKVTNGKKMAKDLYIKYCVKNSSLKAIFNCLNTYKNIRTYFSDKFVIDFIREDDNVKNKILSREVLDIIEKLNQQVEKEKKEEKEEELDNCFYGLRKVLNRIGFNIQDNIEISPENLLPFILIKLNTELNEIALIKNREDEDKKKEMDKKMFTTLRKGKFLSAEQEEKEQSTFEEIFNVYFEKMSSLISRNFISFIKSKYKCSVCGNVIIKFSWNYFIWIPIGKNNYSNSIFNNNYGLISYRSYAKIDCEKCEKNTLNEQFNYFYKSAKNLILIIDRRVNYRYKTNFDFREILRIKNGYNKIELVYKLKGIISKNLNNDEYSFYVENEKNKINDALINQINNGGKDIPIILFYELDNQYSDGNYPIQRAKTEAKAFNALIPDRNAIRQRTNSDLSSFNNNNNINNNIYNNNNSNTYIQPNLMLINQNSLDIQLQKNQNMNQMEMNRNQQYNLGNNNNNIYNNSNNINQFNSDMFFNNGMNNFNNNQQINFNPQTNIPNPFYQKIPSSPNQVNNLNNYNTEINRPYSDNIPYSFTNRILDNEFQIPKYFNGNSNSQNNNITGYIKGKKLEYPKDNIVLL